MLASHLSNFVGPDKARHRVRIVEEGAPKGHGIGVGLERRTDEICVHLEPRSLANRHLYRMLYARLPAVLPIFAGARPSVERLAAELSDGNVVPPGALCFSSSRDDVLLVPDVYFVNSGGFRWARAAAKSAVPWPDRDDRIVWRGQPNGVGAFAAEPMEAANPLLKQRVRMCLLLKDVEGVDAKLVKAGRRATGAERRTMAAQGIVGRRVRESSWARRKYAIDIDGNTNSWSNLYIRLLLGCCVIKIASFGSFRQWYYGALEPWVHFVPVRADMTDLVETIDWCRSHQNECRMIAEAGQAFAMSRTVETELADAIARVEAAHEHRPSPLTSSVSY